MAGAAAIALVGGRTSREVRRRGHGLYTWYVDAARQPADAPRQTGQHVLHVVDDAPPVAA
jgi:hypothetical protein